MRYTALPELLACNDLDYRLERTKRNEKKEERWSSMCMVRGRNRHAELNLKYINPSPANALLKWKQEFRDAGCSVRKELVKFS